MRRAYRGNAAGGATGWRKLLETGAYATVEAILDGRQPAEMTLAGLMRPFTVGWGAAGRDRLRKGSDLNIAVPMTISIHGTAFRS